VTNICKFCGNEWTARVADPKQCPHCKRIAWRDEAVAERVFTYHNDTNIALCLRRLQAELEGL